MVILPMFKIKTYNNIAQSGLDKFPTDTYQVGETVTDPDALLLRSQNLHEEAFNDDLLAIARAGAGVNNIPIDKLTGMGVPVFNTPGANANAVKELVLAGMLLACRNICQAWQYTNELDAEADNLNQQVEAGKKQFVGFELPGKTIAVIGLGAIGVQVANAAVGLGMNVIGFDPAISIQRAWQLSSSVQQADSLAAAFADADFITVHVPYVDATHHLINDKEIARMRDDVILLNFARGAIVDESALTTALQRGKILRYVCDFPSKSLKDNPQVIALPHLGASTKEAELNCAMMAAETLREFLENGHINNAVNFPAVSMPRNGGERLSICNANVPNMVGQISSILGEAKINIIDMINKSLGDIAYTLVDVEQSISAQTVAALSKIDGVLKVRVL